MTLPTDLEKEGIIWRFKFSYELAQQTLKDFLTQHRFCVSQYPSRSEAIALYAGFITDGMSWKAMSDGRNMASHEYDGSKVDDLSKATSKTFVLLIDDLVAVLNQEANKQQ